MSNPEDEKQKVSKQPSKNDTGKPADGLPIFVPSLPKEEKLLGDRQEYHPGSHIPGVPTKSLPPR